MDINDFMDCRSFFTATMMHGWLGTKCIANSGEVWHDFKKYFRFNSKLRLSLQMFSFCVFLFQKGHKLQTIAWSINGWNSKYDVVLFKLKDNQVT